MRYFIFALTGISMLLSLPACKRGSIPPAPITGHINEKETPIASVRIQKMGASYRWVFSNQVPPAPCEPLMGDEAVTFTSPVIFENEFEKKLEDPSPEGTHAFYHYELTPGSPVSINAPWGAKIIVDKIDREKKKVTGWAKIEFKDQKTEIAGAFQADLCE